MVSRYTVHMHRTVIMALRHISRDDAGQITDGIDALTMQPRPRMAIALDKPENSYRIDIAGHIIDYQVRDDEQIIRILFLK